jgi:hypothetical protein
MLKTVLAGTSWGCPGLTEPCQLKKLQGHPEAGHVPTMGIGEPRYLVGGVVPMGAMSETQTGDFPEGWLPGGGAARRSACDWGKGACTYLAASASVLYALASLLLTPSCAKILSGILLTEEA